MATVKFVCPLPYPQMKLRLTSLPVLLIHFMTLLPTISLCLASSHSPFNSSTPLSKIDGDLDLTISVETGICSNMIHTHLSKPEKPLVGEKCDIFTGSWVHDLSYPLYNWSQCHHIDDKFNCQKNGRPDSDYEKWRWKPRDCNIPRFDALHLLQTLSGKKVMFVGDSLTDNQWQSMVCLLSSVLPDRRTAFTGGKPVSTFKALDYNISVSFQWAPYLVDMVNTVIRGQPKIVLQLDSVELNAKSWMGKDILIFESSHWWSHTDRESRGWDYIQEGPNLYKDMDRKVAYRKALSTWAKLIDSNINISRTRVFFRSFSGDHLSARDWNNSRGRNCYRETEPILGSSYPGPYPPQLQIAEDVLSHMNSPVSFLNITTMSLLRKDAHPSIYSTDITAAQRKDPDRYADCTHWCLSGLPDTWNELLYSVLFF